MKLKRLELQGFKSFKDKTVIHFSDGMTGIVGPNGCGKSNIVDAFFWVMGEMSPKHLRGSSMHDVIFSGSDKYEASGEAYVNLVVEQETPGKIPGTTDLQEVVITRKLNREGESSYYINNSQVRLKDVTELMMDLGIGNKSYSIIEQGQIARIVASKPIDRRFMVEELAGVMKFKVRKKETIRKLEQTSQNMSRLDDLLRELEERERTLERQAQKAIKARAIRNELQERDLKATSQQFLELRDELNRLVPQLDQNKGNVAEILIQLEGYNTELEKVRINLAQESVQMEDKRLILVQATELKNEERRKFDQTKSMIEHLNNRKTWLEEEINQSSTNYSKFQEDLKLAVQELESLLPAKVLYDEKIQKIDEELVSLKKNLDSILELNLEHENTFNELNRKYQQEEAKLNQLEFKLGHLKGGLEEVEREKEILNKDLDTSKENLNSLESQVSSKQTFVNEKITSANNLDQLVQQNQASLQSLENELRQLSRSEAALMGKVETIESLVNSHDLFQESTRKILDAHPQAKTLSSLIQVKPGYERAVKSCLHQFEEMLLHANDLQNFDNFHYVYLGNANSTESVLENSMSTMVESVDSEVAQFLRTYLKDFALVNDFSDGASHHQVKQDGSIRYSFGVLGQGVSNAPNLYEEKRKLEQLKVDLDVLVVQKEEKTKIHGETLQTLKDIQNDLKNLRMEIKQTEDELRDLSSSRNFYQKEINASSAKIESLETKHQQWAKDLVVVEENLQTCTGLIETLAKDREDYLNKKQVSFTKLKTLENSLEKTRDERHNLELQEAGRLTKIRSLQVDEDRLKQSIHSLKLKLELQQTEVTSIESEIEGYNNELNSVEEKLAQAVEKEKTYHEAYMGIKQKVDAFNEVLANSLGVIKDLQAQERELNSSIHQMDLQIQKLSMEEEKYRLYLFEKYELESSQIKLIGEPLSKTDLVVEITEVTELREKLKRLGEINYASIEEYDQVQARVSFIRAEKEDLDKSIEQLQDAIHKIENLTTERFRKTFEAVDEKFRKVFPVIFGGGNARLILVSGDENNEDGIDIVAQPPGKKMTNINLMSGGEKAMTAVSLIFAMFLIKPSPFCLLDEVDAPLDDRNVDRFNEMISEMSKKSQFVLITHNKRSMEYQQHLYGVTMQEPGVSRLMSVALQ